MIDQKALEAAMKAFALIAHDLTLEQYDESRRTAETAPLKKSLDAMAAGIEAYLDNLPLPEPVAWITTDHTGCEHWDHDRETAEWRQTEIGVIPQIELYTADAIAKMEADQVRLPCDVHLPPNTTITKGNKLKTLLLALEVRGMKDPDHD